LVILYLTELQLNYVFQHRTNYISVCLIRPGFKTSKFDI